VSVCFRPRITHREYCGYRLFYNPGNSIIERLKKEPIFEEKMCKMIEADLNKSKMPTMLDIGANIGFISLYILNKISKVQIYAFEPGPKQYVLLKKTIDSNNLNSRMELYNRALSDTSGKKTFFTHPHRDMAKDGLMDTGRGEKTIQIDIEAITLDMWWNKAGQPLINVVKIDTEGAELMILRGGKAFLTEVKPVIYMEIEPRNLAAYPYTLNDTIDFMDCINYELFALTGEKVSKDNILELLSRNDTFRAVPLS
jgi:FkbM family methyltransferase